MDQLICIKTANSLSLNSVVSVSKNMEGVQFRISFEGEVAEW